MNILLTGGTGFIGAGLCPILQQRGHRLTIITRSPDKHKDEEEKNKKFISWNADLVSAMEQSEAVINLAGEPIFGRRWTKEVKDSIYNSRINSTKKLTEAIKKAKEPPEVMISASAVGYYGDRGTDILTAEEPPGDDFLAHVCADWEEAAKPVQEVAVRLALPRFGIVLEKGGGALQKILLPFKFFAGGTIGRGTQFFPWIHRRDLCRGIIFALDKEDFEGSFNLNAPHPVVMQKFTSAIGDVLNRPAIFHVPEFLLHFVLGEAADSILESLRAKPKRLSKAGFDFEFNYIREALNNILK